MWLEERDTIVSFLFIVIKDIENRDNETDLIFLISWHVFLKQ